MVRDDKNVKEQAKYGCAIKCQQLILRDFGYDIAEKELVEIAKDNGWYHHNKGILMCDNGKLLGCFGIGYHHLQYNTVEDVVRELKLGHRVMVNVNPDKLHDGPEVSFRHNEASHAVLITMVSESKGFIFFTDPMTGNIDDLCPIDWFQNAWNDSACYMLATDASALFRYDPATQSMKLLSTLSN